MRNTSETAATLRKHGEKQRGSRPSEAAAFRQTGADIPEGEAIGHARDVIRHGARPRGLALCAHRGGIGHVAREEPADDPFGLLAHRHDTRRPIHPPEQELLQRLFLARHLVGECDDRLRRMAHIIRRMRLEPHDAPFRLLPRILNEARDNPPHDLMREARGLKSRPFRVDFRDQQADQRHIAQVIDGKEPGTQAIIEVMGVVGDIVGNCRNLRLRRGMAREIERELSIEFGNRERNALRAVAADGLAHGETSGPLCFTRPSSVSHERLRPSKPA